MHVEKPIERLAVPKCSLVEESADLTRIGRRCRHREYGETTPRIIPDNWRPSVTKKSSRDENFVSAARAQ
jgi:hypothetical protein